MLFVLYGFIAKKMSLSLIDIEGMFIMYGNFAWMINVGRMGL